MDAEAQAAEEAAAAAEAAEAEAAAAAPKRRPRTLSMRRVRKGPPPRKGSPKTGPPPVLKAS